MDSFPTIFKLALHICFVSTFTNARPRRALTHTFLCLECWREKWWETLFSLPSFSFVLSLFYYSPTMIQGLQHGGF